MATFTIIVGPYESAQLLRQALAAPAVGMLRRTDQGLVDAPGYTVMLADGWRADNTGVEGVYATALVDDAVAVGHTASVAALGAKVLPPGNTPNRVLGVSTVDADTMPARINRMMERRLFNSGFDIGTGAARRWYSSDPGFLALYGIWNSLAARMTDTEFDALGLRVQHMDGRTTVLTRALAQSIATAAAQNGDVYRTRARLAIAAWTANPATFRFGDIPWPAGYGE